MKYYSLYFGQAYGEGNYGEGTYSCTTQQINDGSCTSASAGGSTGSGNGSGLTNTGIAVAAIVTLACLIIFVSLIVRIWRRKPIVQPVTIEEDDEISTTDQQL
jgi:hypothetical protein